MVNENIKTIAIDIDDVVSATSDALRIWVNDKTGANLQPGDYYRKGYQYWSYFDDVLSEHGLAENITLRDFFKTYDDDQFHAATIQGATECIAKLTESYDVVFITARPPAQKEATRRWLDEHIDPEIPLYLSSNPLFDHVAQSKGEICAELGVDLLIDDHIDNCDSAMQHGVRAILFGDYGWNHAAPSDIQRCLSWSEIDELFFNEPKA